MHRGPWTGLTNTGKRNGMTTLDDFQALAAREHGLVVVATVRADGTIQSSVVNAGVAPHPTTGRPALGFVTAGRVKLANLRARPRLAATARFGRRWATVEGAATLVGPDDPVPGVSSEDLRLLRRRVFVAAGGTHDDWNDYDRVMSEQRRVVVVVDPLRVYGN
jgi:PPOX class probable F420-dependent enzyme